jgi:pyruvyltransferase
MKKITKIKRYIAARFRPSSYPAFFWHIGTPNFGDDINPSFFEKISGVPVRLEVNQKNPHFLGMGSILERAIESSVVLGSGFIAQPAAPVNLPGRLIAVRGKLSRAAIQNCPEVLLGDPMVLLSQIYIAPHIKINRIGLVPHVSQVNEFKRLAPAGVVIIDPAAEPWSVIRSIAECSYIISQSLHGLIVADALEIPNLWIKPSEQMIGGDFKFLDYFSTIDSPKAPHTFSKELLENPPLEYFKVGRYLYDKSAYHQKISTIINS